VPSEAAVASYRQAAPWLAGLALGPLRYSRDEGRAIVAELGRGTRLLVGGEASERALKSTDLRAYGVLHLAAHAVVDDEHPERSAVVLAPGAADEDGLLQTRDVLGLDLRGRAVVLAACETAAGPEVQGEGMLSLARAFLQAGAHAVIGSRWPLSDQDALALMPELYRGLGDGLPIAQAMAQARRKAIRTGAPAAAWAGLEVVGEGGLAPIRHPTASRRGALIVALAVFAAVLSGVWAVARFRAHLGQRSVGAGATRAR